MHSRTRLWITLLIVLFVVTFLIGFQPIRRPTQAIAPEATFTFKLPQALTENSSEFSQKAMEVQDALTSGGVNKEDIEEVTLLSGDRVQVKTYALDADQATQDEQNLLKALQGKYAGVAAEPRQDTEQTAEKPLWQLGNALAIYMPKPQVKLGLDLQGGLHVVLRCLPFASMSFTTEEAKNQPLYVDAAAAAEAAKPEAENAEAKPEGDNAEAKPEAPTEKPATTVTRAELEKRVVAELVRRGLGAEKEIKAEAVSPNRLLVTTQAPDERTAKAQRSTILGMMQGMYPSYAINPEGFESVPIEADTADKVKNIIDKRLFSLGEIREPVIQEAGRDKIIVEIPGVKDTDRVASILKSTAMLEFRLIPQNYENATPGEDSYDEWKDKRSGQMVGWERVLAEAKVTAPGSRETDNFRGSDLVPNSKVVPSNTPGQWEVTFELRADRKRAFHEFTRRNVGRLMAIVLDGKCQMAPVIKSPIPGQGVIEGNFSTEEAGDLRLLLNAGALPVPLEIAENRTVSATLGQDTIIRSMRAGVVGLIAVLLFMVVYYGVPGLMADVALIIYIMAVLAIVGLSQVVKGFGGITLTLPGIAGLIISIGMAVDANVLIFERMKEELRAGKSTRAAVVAGFERAWTAILDSNVTTLITCAVLYFLGTSIIKSFAALLFIGVVCSFFTAVTVSRWLITMMAETKLGQNPAVFGVPESERRQ